MGKLSNSELQHLAQMGAELVLMQNAAEQARILQAFPDLRPTTTPAPRNGTGRKRMSKAMRQAISVRMRRYWKQRHAKSRA